MNLSRGLVLVGDDDERVDLEVAERQVSYRSALGNTLYSRELAVNVDGIQSRDEVDENIVHTLRNLLQEGSSNLLVRRELLKVDGDKKLLSLLIDITNIDTTLVGEKDPITLKRDC